ncbi:sterol desaturase [Malassezia pachydermatis]|uniref:Sterol desaturase n=1 Tax=Malassezia pachydermatis TaxID=77020 RepID=A0A0M8MNC8_9BASI|nr:sterol desaturase [Malassezia pachydermatis]KOS13577.1 sterol desaturase [Malassezia pachydermatis]
MDFIYYWVHRATHEVEWLWKFHQKHHTTKHPCPFLLAYADEIQEVFDLIGTPSLTYALYPVPFDVLYIWSLFLVAIEAMGHSGVRLYFPGLLTFGILRPVECDITVEDHDLHHRYGWKQSYNYGKQTMLWDQLFGTKAERLETSYDNVDWNNVCDV